MRYEVHGNFKNTRKQIQITKTTIKFVLSLSFLFFFRFSPKILGMLHTYQNIVIRDIGAVCFRYFVATYTQLQQH
jgi:hypothetical protein